MGIKISTGLANAMLSGGGMRTALDGMVMRIYSGVEPQTADDALGAAVLLVTITGGGDGSTPLTFETNAVDGVLSKNSGQVWEGTAVANGTATFCRLAPTADAGGFSTTAVRIQGDAGLAGRFLNLTSTAIVTGAVQRIGNLSVAVPRQ
jgi:hypothetical protein